MTEIERDIAQKWMTGDDSPEVAIRRALERARATEPEIELQCAIPNSELQHVFAALCLRYGVEPYRRPRQQMATMNLHVPKSWGHGVFWPVFAGMGAVIEAWLAAETRSLMHEWGAPPPPE